MRALCLLSFCLIVAANARDKAMSGGGYYAKVLGQSGKITLGNTPDPEQDPERITIRLRKLVEVSAQGEPVGLHGNDRHVINSFATQSFTFGDLEAAQVGTANATTFRFSSDIDNGARLDVDVFLIESAGVMNSTVPLPRGALKFNVEISAWDFCGRNGYVCTNEDRVGEFLELDIEIKGYADAPANGTVTAIPGSENKQVNLIEDVLVDGVWETLPTPVRRVDDTTLRFTFQAFDDSLFYDPIIADDETATTSKTILVVIIASIAIALASAACISFSRRSKPHMYTTSRTYMG